MPRRKAAFCLREIQMFNRPPIGFRPVIYLLSLALVIGANLAFAARAAAVLT